MHRVLMLAVIAVAWPWWGQVLREILRDVRKVSDPGDSSPAASPAAQREPRRLVNTPWDSARVGMGRGTRRLGYGQGASRRGRL